jgi:hypothetical protein
VCHARVCRGTWFDVEDNSIKLQRVCDFATVALLTKSSATQVEFDRIDFFAEAAT